MKFSFLTYFLFVFVVSPVSAITLIEVSPVHFGSVSGQLGLSCAMSQYGVISGACDASDGEISVGQITVTDLPRKGTVEVILKGSTNSALTFTPLAELTGAKGGTIYLYENQPVSAEVKGNGAEFSLTVYGSFSLVSDITLSGPYTVDYSIEINPQ
ncbi:hypothetical protein D210916BOD24_06030 [Alteromonas sp. D210916BOD_24]|uniref:hypothetical protein n=1 Tax=Alteromonas sp. D210916BOD_24 TaxID=3157618 RepID=UPI00399C7D4A